MIGQFYPFMVTATVTAVSFNSVTVRATSAATELANSTEWLLQDQ